MYLKLTSLRLANDAAENDLRVAVSVFRLCGRSQGFVIKSLVIKSVTIVAKRSKLLDVTNV
jgi:hypothetical protein